jgi:transcriptional regulator with XRE-family HTH domain
MATLAAVDDLAVGRLFRQIRVRLGWPQKTVASRADISEGAYSAIERGFLETVPLGKLRRVAAVLEVRLPLDPRWRGAAVDRLVSSRHAQMTEVVARMLIDAGWEIRPEASFNHFGERGVVDIVAWHGAMRTVMLIEIKTELVDIGELLAVSDRRRRLAAKIVEPFGWRPVSVASWIVVAESRTNRRRLEEHRSAIRSAFPADGRSIAGWLRRPKDSISAFWFLPNFSGTSLRPGPAPRHRVRSRTVNVASRD